VVTHFPYFLLVWSFWEPFLLPNSVKLVITRGGRIQIESQAIDRSAIFTNLVNELKLLFDKKNLVQILMAVLKGENLIHQMKGFLNILARVKEDDVHQTAITEKQFLRMYSKVILN
jgi:hypothetical protein